jgi:alpha-glucosidase
MPASNLYEAARNYAELSGAPAVPPRWTFGYLQSRWGWQDRAYIDDTLKQFVTRKLPVDAFIFDFEWYTVEPDYELPPEGDANFKDFSFNPALFPDPSGQIATMDQNGIHFVGIRKPRLGNLDLLNMARAKGWLLPGKTHVDVRNIDFRRDDVRDWYADQIIPLLKSGVSGWWDDEGELTFTTYYWWNQAEAQALAKVNPTARLWTIDRAFQPGLQRLGAAAWTGDIHANWQTLRRTPTDLLNWSLAGMDYSACDIGGFIGEDTPELLTRWMEAGVFFPVMRSHSDHKVQPRFPWLYGADAESAIQHALDLRYRLIPYLYSLAHEAHEIGAPLMRPLAMEFPDDPKAAEISSQWLLGSRLMAAPILTPENKRSVYLPNDSWFQFDTNTLLSGNRDMDVNAGLADIPAYVRAGTILPLAPPIQHTAQLPGGPLQLQVYPGGDAQFTLVEDDGESTAYLNGNVRRTTFAWDNTARKLTWKITGPYAGADIFKTMQVTVFDPAGIHQAAGDLSANGSASIPQ